MVADARIEVRDVGRENERRVQMRLDVGLDVPTTNATVAELRNGQCRQQNVTEHSRL